MRSLRAQRVAVEQLKEKARQDEISAETLRRKLRDAEGKIKELKAQGGRDLVRRLMDEVSQVLGTYRVILTRFVYVRSPTISKIASNRVW